MPISILGGICSRAAKMLSNYVYVYRGEHPWQYRMLFLNQRNKFVLFCHITNCYSTLHFGKPKVFLWFWYAEIVYYYQFIFMVLFVIQQHIIPHFVYEIPGKSAFECQGNIERSRSMATGIKRQRVCLSNSIKFKHLVTWYWNQVTLGYGIKSPYCQVYSYSCACDGIAGWRRSDMEAGAKMGC